MVTKQKLNSMKRRDVAPYSKLILASQSSATEKTKIIDSITHTLKTLHIGFSELLEKVHDEAKSSQQKKHLEILLASAEEQFGLTQTLLMLMADLDKHKTQVNSVFNLKGLLYQISDLVRPYQYDRAISIHYPKDLSETFLGNKYRIYFVLLSLITFLEQSIFDGEIDIALQENQKTNALRTSLTITLEATEEATKPYFDGIISRFYHLYQAGEATALSLTKQLIEELNVSLQFCVISSDKKYTNNNKKIKEEVSQKQKGCQFKLSLPVIVDRSGRSFLYASSSQGEKLC
ncbi:MAG TPA: hypothetical protein DIC51_05355 [Coxiellaceae bacterium]|nr:hypothetical protein [Coxiellaceae bacterium]